MDEKDKEIQELRRKLKAVTEENDALMGELNGIADCTTCEHYDECHTSIERYRYQYSEACKDAGGYKWRGIEAYEEWNNEQQALKRLEAEAEAEEARFERAFKGVEE